MEDASVKEGHHPLVIIKNKTDQDLSLPTHCPQPPVDVFLLRESGTEIPLTAEDTVRPCQPLEVVPAGKSTTYDLGPWKYSLFSELGTYKLTLPVEGDIAEYPDTQLSAEVELFPAGTITQIFRTFVSKPLLNALLAIASVLPNHSLGWSIILLTVAVKLLLFWPTQHAMEGQRKMQAIQPETDALRKKHKDDPKKLQEETLKLWKKNNVNPMQSCLPTLVQFPVLIGLFFVVRDGSVMELSRHLLYDTFTNVDWSTTTTFFGLELLEPNYYILPPLLMVAQFLQMKLTFAITKKKQSKKDESTGFDQQKLQQRLMTYGLPIMIGGFALQFPAAVGLYWGISTVFAIGQQLVVNRKEL